MGQAAGEGVLLAGVEGPQQSRSPFECNLDAVAACLPTFRDTYLGQFRTAGFSDVRITAETPYPSSYIMDDPGVKEHIATHPDAAPALERFASSISGAHFEATKA